MNSEEIIQAFVQVIEDYCDVFVSFPEAMDDLDYLNQTIIQLENKPNQEIAKAIQEWLYKYPSIAERVRDIYQPPVVRKPSAKPSSSKPSPSIKEENIITNRFPELPKILRKRIIGYTETATQKNES